MAKTRIEMERRFWSRFAARYDGFVRKQVSSYTILIEKILSEIKTGSSVLEVAAGTGLITLPVAGKAKSVHAVDITPEMIACAEKKAKDRGITNIVFSVQDAYALPFSNGMFDAVICSNALHNMREPERALSEMRRVMRPTSILITATVCHGENLKSRIISRLMALTGFPAYHRFNRERLSRLIEDSGFEITRREMIPETIPMAFIIGRPR